MGASRSIAGIGLLVALIPVVTLAYDGATRGRCSAAPTSSTTSRWCSRRCSSSPGYVVVLLSTNYIAEGDYWEGEYYQLILARSSA